MKNLWKNTEKWKNKQWTRFYSENLIKWRSQEFFNNFSTFSKHTIHILHRFILDTMEKKAMLEVREITLKMFGDRFSRAKQSQMKWMTVPDMPSDEESIERYLRERRKSKLSIPEKFSIKSHVNTMFALADADGVKWFMMRVQERERAQECFFMLFQRLLKIHNFDMMLMLLCMRGEVFQLIDIEVTLRNIWKNV